MKADPKQWRNCTHAGSSGFTLVELLLVISILAILSGLSLSLIHGARYEANASRTETQIRRIMQFLQDRIREYQVRVLPYKLRGFTNGGMPLQPIEIARLRHRILIEYITSELPCDPSQIALIASSPPYWNGTRGFVESPQFNADFGTYMDSSGTRLIDVMRNQPPTLVKRMARKLGGTPPAATTTDDTASAECLYEILNSQNDYATSGLDALFPDEIGDTDGDKHNEVLDAWGDPLLFYVTLGAVPRGPGVPPSANLVNPNSPPVDLLNRSQPADILKADEEGPTAVRFYLKSKNLLDR